MTMNNKRLQFLAAAFLCILLICGVFCLPVSADEGIRYIDENGEEQICRFYQLLNTEEIEDIKDVTLVGGWYVVTGEVTFRNRLTIDAPYMPDPEVIEEYGLEPVRLILCDGCRLDLKQGIRLEMDNGLQIYGQKGGTGSLYAEYRDSDDMERSHAVIGGNAPKGSGGCLDINGGEIHVTGYTAGACIGGSAGGALEEINIRGGKTSIENTAGGPAIGVGLGYNNRPGRGRVCISGGEVSADSYYRSQRTSDAIGGHYECGGLEELRIIGGRVTAFGRYATIDQPPCAMMTYGSLILGDDMLVSAGSDPGHLKKAPKEERINAVRSNIYAEVSAPGSDTRLGASVFSSRTSVLCLAAAAGIFLIAAIIVIRRHSLKKSKEC